MKYAFIAASAVLPNDDWKASENKAGVLNGYDISIVCEEVRRAKEAIRARKGGRENRCHE